MKKYILTLVFAAIAMILQAQEVMKVELKEGGTVEYKVDNIKRVFFDTVTPTEDDDIKTDYLIMFVGDKEKIEGTVVTATSENTFVASVNGNTVTANHVGVTFILVNEKHPVIIMVLSLNTSIPNPVLKWGAPKDTIKAHHTTGTIDHDDDTMLTYKNCGDALAIGYYFDENGKLILAGLSVKASKSQTLLNYLLDRYIIYPEKDSNGNYYGLNGYDKEHITTAIMYNPSNNTCAFIKYEGSESRIKLSRMMKGIAISNE